MPTVKEIYKIVQGLVSATVNRSFETVSYSASKTIAHNPARPNKTVALAGDISINTTGATSGSEGAIEITDATGGNTVIVNGTTITENTTAGAPMVIKWLYTGNVYLYQSGQETVSAYVPTPPVLTADDTADTLTASHALTASEILYSENGGAYAQYTGSINVGNVSRAEGYYKFKIKSAAGRSESAVVNSPAFTLAITGGSGDLLWSDTATWGGTLPTSTDTPTIPSGKAVVYDLADGTFAGVNIEGTLKFKTDSDCLLKSTKNVVVSGSGKLEIKPASNTVDHTLRFINVDENAFIGDGVEVLASDVGLWIMDNGQIDAVGSTKTSWTRAAGSISAGATSITLEAAPTGWQIGDLISIAPTKKPAISLLDVDNSTQATLDSLEERVITGISGAVISFATPLVDPHPKITVTEADDVTIVKEFTAEIMNLTRNVIIEGTSGGRSHILITATAIQTVKYVAIPNMGPRIGVDGVLGRYALHFHHGNDIYGSVVEGCVVKDCGNHAYVPHGSHGIMLKNNIAYKTVADAFWWDSEHKSHHITYDGNIVAGNWTIVMTTPRNWRDSSMMIGLGDNNIANNNVVVASIYQDGAAYNWEEHNDSLWQYRNNLAHNCGRGIVVWQNGSSHDIDAFNAYHCTEAIQHGAYVNGYRYRDMIMHGNDLDMYIHAGSVDSTKVKIETSIFDGLNVSLYAALIDSSPLFTDYPVTFIGCHFKNYTQAGVYDDAQGNKKNMDFINCTTDGNLFAFSELATNTETARVQPLSGQATSTTKLGTTNIANFAPSIWGTGEGLLGQYFIGTDFTNLVMTKIDRLIGFWWYSNSGFHPYHKIPDDIYSVRWTGFIEPQFTEDYTFKLAVGGAVRLWINNVLVIDQFAFDNYPTNYFSAPIALTAGTKYAIKIEYYNEDFRSEVQFFWSSASLPIEYVPQSQLYHE